MLVSKYQRCIIKKDLDNAIYMFRCEKLPSKNDAFNLLNSLLEKRINDSGGL